MILDLGYISIFNFAHHANLLTLSNNLQFLGHRTDRDSNLTVTINVSVETTIRTFDVYFFSVAPLVCLKGKQR